MLKEVIIRALFYGFVITIGFYLAKKINKNEENIKFKQIVISILLGITFSLSVNLILGLIPSLNTKDKLIIDGRTFLFAGFVAPIAEELIFRGVIFSLLRKKLKFIVSMLISSALFCAVHSGLGEIIYSFLLGALLCFCFEKIKNIKSVIIIHSIANITTLVLALVFDI